MPRFLGVIFVVELFFTHRALKLHQADDCEVTDLLKLEALAMREGNLETLDSNILYI